MSLRTKEAGTKCQRRPNREATECCRADSIPRPDDQVFVSSHSLLSSSRASDSIIIGT